MFKSRTKTSFQKTFSTLTKIAGFIAAQGKGQQNRFAARSGSHPVPLVLNSQTSSNREVSPVSRTRDLEVAPNPADGHPSVVVVDPSCFTLPYDYCLCDALVRRGCKVVLAQSEFTYAKWDLPGSFGVWEHFYQYTGRKAGGTSRRKMWKLAKGVEHAFSMRGFVAEIRRRKPDIVHFQWLLVPLLDQLFLSRLGRNSHLVLTLHNTAAIMVACCRGCIRKWVWLAP